MTTKFWFGLAVFLSLLSAASIAAVLCYTQEMESQTIAYVSIDREAANEINLLDTRDNRSLRLETGGLYGVYFDWSPDGEHLAFNPLHDVDEEIYSFDVNRKTRKALTDNPNSDSYPAWSSDGKRIAFNSMTHSGLQIQMVDADGENLDSLTFGEDQANSTAPTWSPDNRHIAYIRSNTLFIQEVDCADCPEQSLGIDYQSPAWSPDGRWLAFTTFRDGNNEIYKMDMQAALADHDCGMVDGVCAQYQQRLTSNNAFDDAPDWSPDSQQIVFMSDRDGDMEVFVMDANGNNQRQLTFNDMPDGWPKWRP
jgi:Tol biopolymer transport system component